MQKVLTIKIGRGKIISKPWDFEALCLVDDNKRAHGTVEICQEALYYLFEGSKATNETIQRLSYKTLSELCEQIWDWYMNDISKLLEIQQNNPPIESNGAGEGLRGLYNALFKAWGILGSEVAKQKPDYIFMLLRDDEEKAEMSGDTKALYGI